ncbi:MAG: APC family permease [Phycisphaerales bacterium]
MPDPVSPRADLPRRIGFWGASAVMVGVIIGSGIFQTPPGIAKELASPLLILFLWLLGGGLALLGAFTFAELACMYPQSGGVYVFLRQGLGPRVAFVFGWTYMLLTKPFAAAGIAFIFAEHLNRLLGTTLDPRLITTAVLVTLTAINIVGVGPSTGLAKILTALKFGALAAIVLLALLLRKGDAANFAAVPLAEAKPIFLAIAPVMAAIMWTYDGWSDVGAIAGEVKDPTRSLPRIFIAGTLATTALYVAVNAVYHWLLPMAELRATSTVAPLVMSRLVGDLGTTAVTAIVLASTLGSSHSSVLTGARVTFAQARDGLLFSWLAAIHPRLKTPHIALLQQLGFALLALWVLGNFKSLADGFVFTMWIFYGLGGVAIFILRRREPDRPRPFRCPGYPIVPAIFVLSALAMTALTIWTDVSDPKSRGMATLPWIGILFMGLPVYSVWKNLTNQARA